MTDYHQVQIVRVDSFELAVIDNGGETLNVLQFNAPDGPSPLLALSQLQAAQLRDALGKGENVVAERAWSA